MRHVAISSDGWGGPPNAMGACLTGTSAGHSFARYFEPGKSHVNCRIREFLD